MKITCNLYENKPYFLLHVLYLLNVALKFGAIMV